MRKERKRTKTAPVSRARKATAEEARKYTPTEPARILGRAMLVNVCIGMWEGRKHDREVTAQVNDANHASTDAGRYNKHLFGGKVKELSALVTAAAMLRHEHYAQTLPWSDAGWRLLPTTNYMEYQASMRKARERFTEAATTFVTAYPRLVNEAKAKLNGMYKAGDYPHPNAVIGKYTVRLDYSPLPAGDDFRVTLPSEEMAHIAADVEERVNKSVALAMADAWARLGDAVSDLRAKLDDGKYLRDSMIERLLEVADVLGRLNLTGDEALEATRAQVVATLGSFDAKTLRDDSTVRAQAADAADAILASMRSVYGAPAKETK